MTLAPTVPSLTGTALLGADSRGIWTRREALTVLTRGRLQSEVRRGHWQVLWPGAFADGGVALDAEQWAYAAVLASDDRSRPSTGADGRSRPSTGADGRRTVRAVAWGRTAARVHGLPLIDDDDPATGAREWLVHEVAVRTGAGALRGRTPDGHVRVLRRHVRSLTGEDLVRTPSGLWVTTPLRTLVDCAALLAPEALTCALDHALRRHLVDEQQLAQAVARRAWCPGAPALRWAVERADRRAESPAETLSRLALLPTGLALVPQVRLFDDRGRVLARFDLADEALCLAVEADGQAGHAGPAMVAKDRRRDALTASLGWRTERVTWWELRRDRDAFVRRVEAAAAEQAGRVRR